MILKIFGFVTDLLEQNIILGEYYKIQLLLTQLFSAILMFVSSYAMPNIDYTCQYVLCGVNSYLICHMNTPSILICQMCAHVANIGIME